MLPDQYPVEQLRLEREQHWPNFLYDTYCWKCGRRNIPWRTTWDLWNTVGDHPLVWCPRCFVSAWMVNEGLDPDDATHQMDPDAFSKVWALYPATTTMVDGIWTVFVEPQYRIGSFTPYQPTREQAVRFNR